MHPSCSPLLIYYWYQGICWKLNTVWHCKSYLGKEQRIGDTAEHFFPHFSHFSSPIPHFPHFSYFFSLFFTFSCFSHFLSLIVTLFLKESWDLPSLTVNVWYIPWSRRYLTTIIAEHTRFLILSGHPWSWKCWQKRHLDNISIPVFWVYQGYQNISWKRHFTDRQSYNSWFGTPGLQDSGAPGLQVSRTPTLLRLPHSQIERFCIFGAPHIFSDELFCSMSGNI